MARFLDDTFNKDVHPVQDVVVASSALPTGAATEAKQTSLNNAIGNPTGSPDPLTVIGRIKSVDGKIGNIGVALDNIVNGTAPASVTLTGSKVCLSTEEKPAGVQGDTLLEYNPTTKETKVYKYISGDWREL